MRAARSLALDRTEVQELPDPEPGPGEVVCRVLACGVCGSDVLDWYVERKLPAVLGHEPAGEVLAVGKGVPHVAVGDRVALHHHVACGECRRCRRGHETLCERFRATGLDPGGFAERVRVPAELVAELLPLDGIDPETATFVEPLACVLRSRDRAGARPGDAILVVGAGVSGLLHVMAAHAHGSDVVWVREPRPDRRALALALGAEHHGNELVDAAFVCSSSPAAIAEAAAFVAPGGSLCLYAPPAPGTPLGIDGELVFMRELSISASYSAGPADMQAALALLRDGAVDPAPLVSHRFGLDGVGRGLELTRRHEALKVVIRP